MDTKKIGIDCSFIDASRVRGQAMCALNLVRGFDAIYDGSYQVIVFCNSSIEHILNSSCNHIKYYPTKELSIRHNNKFDIIIGYIKSVIYYEFYFSSAVKKSNVDVMIFMHDFISIRNIYNNIFTIINTQDVGPIKKNREKEGIFSRLFRAYAKIRYKLDFSHMDKVISISKDDRESLLSVFPQFLHKIRQVYVPIDTEGILINTNEQYNSTIVVLNYAYAHKNAMTILEAFELIKDLVPHNLILVGDVYEECRKYAVNHELLDRVIFTGRVSDEERNNFLKHSELYVSASMYEGFGMTTIEAIILGHKVLLADIPINREVAENIAHYYSPPMDSSALAKEILYCLDQKSQITKAEKDYVVKKYSQNTIAQKYLDIIREEYCGI